MCKCACFYVCVYMCVRISHRGAVVLVGPRAEAQERPQQVKARHLNVDSGRVYGCVGVPGRIRIIGRGES